MDWKDTLKNLKESGSLPQVHSSADENENALPRTAEIKHKGKLHIALERKGRAGKTATIIYGFNGSDEELKTLAKTLRHRLGTGGSARGAEILLQGDCRSQLQQILAELGYKF